MRKLRRGALPRGLGLTETHEAIEELLAGYVLRSLSGEDAARADHLLSDHVPQCPALPRFALPCSRPLTARSCAGRGSRQAARHVAAATALEISGAQDRRKRRPVAVFAVARERRGRRGLRRPGRHAEHAHERHPRRAIDDVRSASTSPRQPGASDGAGEQQRTRTPEPITEISTAGRRALLPGGQRRPGAARTAPVYRVWLLSELPGDVGHRLHPRPRIDGRDAGVRSEPLRPGPASPSSRRDPRPRRHGIAVWQTAS